MMLTGLSGALFFSLKVPLLEQSLARAEAPPVRCSVLAHTHHVGQDAYDTVSYYNSDTEKWSLLAVNGEAPSEEVLSAYMARERSPWRNGYMTTEDLAWSLEPQALVERDHVAVYRAEDLPDGTVSVEGRDISDHAMLDLEVIRDEKGVYVHRQRIFAPKRFRVEGLRVLDADFTTQYGRLPDGRPVTVRTETHSHVRYFGQDRENWAVTVYSGHDCD